MYFHIYIYIYIYIYICVRLKFQIPRFCPKIHATIHILNFVKLKSKRKDNGLEYLFNRISTYNLINVKI